MILEALVILVKYSSIAQRSGPTALRWRTQWHRSRWCWHSFWSPSSLRWSSHNSQPHLGGVFTRNQEWKIVMYDFMKPFSEKKNMSWFIFLVITQYIIYDQCRGGERGRMEGPMPVGWDYCGKKNSAGQQDSHQKDGSFKATGWARFLRACSCHSEPDFP